MPRDTCSVFSLPVEHARHNIFIQQILTVSAPVEWLWVNDFNRNEYPIWHVWPAIVDIWRTSYQNMKHQSSLHRPVITGGSEKAERVPRRMDYRIGVIEFYVIANNKKQHVT